MGWIEQPQMGERNELTLNERAVIYRSSSASADVLTGRLRSRLGSVLTPLVFATCAVTATFAPLQAASDTDEIADEQVVETAESGLFQEIDDPRGKTRSVDPKIVRSRAVTVDLAQLTRIDPAAGDTVTFNLFDDASFDVVFERTEPVSATTSGWIGRFADVKNGTAAFVVTDGVLAANIHTTGDEAYQVRYLEDDVYTVNLIDPSAFPPCAADNPHVVKPAQIPGSDRKADRLSHNHEIPGLSGEDEPAPAGLVIDVLVVYTNLARAAAGGTAAMNALVDLGVLETNDAYYNSGVYQRINLVYKGEVDYAEPGHIYTALDDLTYKYDGVMNVVHDLRGIYGADMVSLIIEDTSYCGLAWTLVEIGIPVWYDYTFSVVQVDCVAGPDWSFAHELGHNMACFHDRDNTDPEGLPPLYPYAYGHRFYGDSGAQWRTIMSYAPGTRIQLFSNPYAVHDGQPAGEFEGNPGEAYNARTLNRTGTFIQDLREPVGSIVWVQFGYSGIESGTFANPVNSLSEGINAIPNGGTVAVKNGSSSASQLLTKPMMLRAYDGSVTLGR